MLMSARTVRGASGGGSGRSGWVALVLGRCFLQKFGRGFAPGDAAEFRYYARKLTSSEADAVVEAPESAGACSARRATREKIYSIREVMADSHSSTHT